MSLLCYPFTILLPSHYGPFTDPVPYKLLLSLSSIPFLSAGRDRPICLSVYLSVSEWGQAASGLDWCTEEDRQRIMEQNFEWQEFGDGFQWPEVAEALTDRKSVV